MKKTQIALMMGIVLMTTTGLKADTSVFGSIEQGLQVSDNGTSEIVAKGTIIGAKFSTNVNSSTEEGQLGPRVFGTLSADVDPSGPNALTTRDAFVGIGTENVTLSLGRMQNIQDSISEATVGIFAEGTDLKSRNAARNSNTAKVSLSLGDDINLAASTVVNGSDGSDGFDSWEVGYSHTIFSRVNLVSAYAKDENTGIRTILGGATTDIGPVSVGGIFEQDKTSAGLATESITGVASIDVGKVTLKGGYQTIADGADSYLAEAEHKFSSAASAFVNGKHIDDTSDSQVYTVGFRYSF